MNVLAFDFGASSGRAIIGSLENGKIKLTEVHRFDNEPVYLNGGLYWDLSRLFHEVKQGIRKAKEYGFEYIGIDTWGVDYALVTRDGLLLGNPHNYRDERTIPMRESLKSTISDTELYTGSGIQVMNINTLYQMLETKENHPDFYALADKMILIPDLFGYLLTGEVYAERSIASTTSLLNPYTKEWNTELIVRLGLKQSLFPKVIDSGTVVGRLSDEICKELETEPKSVAAVCGHDTASAVAAVPAEGKDFVYISCGTWSLFGTELLQPCITEMSARMNVSNETGYANTTRFLKNIIGLWIIQETRRQFRREGKEDLPECETMTVFDEDEIKKFKAEAFATHPSGKRKHQQAAAYVLILNTGMRAGEALALRNCDIDVEGRQLHIRKSVKEIYKREGIKAIGGKSAKVGKTKTATSKRTIPLNSAAIEMIKELRKEFYFGEETPLICDEHGEFTKPLNFRKRYYRILNQAGIETKGLHSLRHPYVKLKLKISFNLFCRRIHTKVFNFPYYVMWCDKSITPHQTLDLSHYPYSHPLKLKKLSLIFIKRIYPILNIYFFKCIYNFFWCIFIEIVPTKTKCVLRSRYIIFKNFHISVLKFVIFCRVCRAFSLK